MIDILNLFLGYAGFWYESAYRPALGGGFDSRAWVLPVLCLHFLLVLHLSSTG